MSGSPDVDAWERGMAMHSKHESVTVPRAEMLKFIAEARRASDARAAIARYLGLHKPGLDKIITLLQEIELALGGRRP